MQTQKYLPAWEMSESRQKPQPVCGVSHEPGQQPPKGVGTWQKFHMDGICPLVTSSSSLAIIFSSCSTCPAKALSLVSHWPLIQKSEPPYQGLFPALDFSSPHAPSLARRAPSLVHTPTLRVTAFYLI